MPKCRPSKYNVIVSRDVIEYGMRCQHIPARRFKTEEARQIAIKDHKRSTKKSSKQK